MRLKTTLLTLLLFVCISLTGQEYQLSKPLIQLEDGGFFDKRTEVSLDFRLEGSTLYYTLDGSEPTEQSQRYKNAITIEESCTIKIKAYKEGFRPSDTVVAQLQKLGLDIQAIKLSPEPSEAYPGEGGSTLIDRKAGSMNFRDGKWLGYNNGTVTITLDLSKNTKVKEVMLSTLTSASAWIMPPASITFMTSEDGQTFKKAKQLSVPLPKQTDPSGKVYYSTQLNNTHCQYLQLIIEPLNSLPDWHPGKGTPGWLFLDEIIIR